MTAAIIDLPEALQIDWLENGPPSAFELAPDIKEIRFVAAQKPPRLVDPSILASLGVWSMLQASLGRKITIDESLKSPYSWRSGLLSVLLGKPGEGRASSERGWMLPTVVRESSQIPRLLDRLSPIKQLPGATIDATNYCLSELLRNVFEHAESPVGACVAAGYFPSSERLTIAVVDGGVTISSHFGRIHGKGISDEQSFVAALQPKASGSLDRDRNAGLGLFMVSALAKELRGDMLVRSGFNTASLRAKAAGPQAQFRMSRSRANWPGAAIILSLYPSAIERSGLELSELTTLINHRLQQTGNGFNFKIYRNTSALPEGGTLIQVGADIDGLAENKDRIADLRDNTILPALQKGERVVLSFAGIALTTQSFMHALLVKIIRAFPKDFGDRVSAVAVSPHVASIVHMVLSYTQDELTNEEHDTPLA